MAQYAEQYAFASGSLIGTRTDVANATPMRFGTLQDIQVDITMDQKVLTGQKKFPVALGQGKGKIECKAKLAEISVLIWNNLYFGQTINTGAVGFADNEAGVIPASTPFIVTVMNSATFVSDQGVKFFATGQRLAKVAAGTTPLTGQYSVTAGTYTFAAADTLKQVMITYTYSTTSGLYLPIANTLMGTGPSFSVVLGESYDTKGLVIQLPQCQSGKLSMPFKQDDFMISEMDFMVSQDIMGNVIYFSTQQ
jgi:hypothetical protein